MTTEMLETHLQKWQRLLLVFAGASGTLLVAAVAEAPLQGEAYRKAGNVMLVSPMFGLALVLGVACLSAGIALLGGRAWQTLAPARRRPTAFSYLACAWSCLVAMDVRMLPVEPPLLLHLAVFGLGIACAAAAWLSLRPRACEELFP